MDLLIDRSDLHNVEMVETPDRAALAPGQARLRVDCFSLTANNITYAAAGDFMKYWQFFPAPEGKGRVPVWGFADVVDSTTEGVSVGDRFYGYYTMSPELVVTPVQVGDGGFTDGAEHRQGLAFIYNRYNNTKTDPAYDGGSEDYQMIFRPLFTTAFLIDDFLADSDFFGAKKSFSPALHQRPPMARPFWRQKDLRCRLLV